ncbi:hypothetical protein MKEN_01386600 [Mycena kentingensis (nom. inval.)]|nr:hypothetical protein MKEN_01386600 [Mycena kentingensis (nom. inval.)]
MRTLDTPCKPRRAPQKRRSAGATDSASGPMCGSSPPLGFDNTHLAATGDSGGGGGGGMELDDETYGFQIMREGIPLNEEDTSLMAAEVQRKVEPPATNVSPAAAGPDYPELEDAIDDVLKQLKSPHTIKNRVAEFNKLHVDLACSSCPDNACTTTPNTRTTCDNCKSGHHACSKRQNFNVWLFCQAFPDMPLKEVADILEFTLERLKILRSPLVLGICNVPFVADSDTAVSPPTPSAEADGAGSFELGNTGPQAQPHEPTDSHLQAAETLLSFSFRRRDSSSESVPTPTPIPTPAPSFEYIQAELRSALDQMEPFCPAYKRLAHLYEVVSRHLEADTGMEG